MPAHPDPVTALVTAALVLGGGSLLLSIYLLVAHRRGLHGLGIRAGILASLDEASATLVDLDDRVTVMATALDRLDGVRQQLDQRAQDVVLLAAGLPMGTATEALRMAARQLQEMNQSFSMQYLVMQQKIQQETREFNLLSNVMKTKHEAAKNAVNNIR